MNDFIMKSLYLDGDGSYIVIADYPNGKFYNLYGCRENGEGSTSSAGGFKDMIEARDALHKHRPLARKIKGWYEHSDVHTYEVEKLADNSFSVKLYEIMGGRWVQLGSAEICDLEILKETIGIDWRE